jgi:hypothetical protein
MIKFGWTLTVYLCSSFTIFLITSFTITSWIVYLFLLLPFYGVVLLGCWAAIWRNRIKTGKINYSNWGVVLVLQSATILASPSNCFGVKQGSRCYSNLQTLLSEVPRTGFSSSPHWNQVEDAFPWLLATYALALVVVLSRTSKEKSIENMTTK